MTSPIKTRIVVTVNMQRWTLRRLAIEIPFHHGDTKTCRSFAGDFGQGITELVPSSLCWWWSAGRPRPATLLPHGRGARPSITLRRSRHGQRMHRLFEHSPAMLVALELIKAGASRGQKNHVTRDGSFARAAEWVFESSRMVDFGRALNLRRDLGGGGPYGVHALHPLSQQFMEHGIVASFIFAAENQVQVWRNVRRKGFQRLDRSVYVRRLGVVVVIHAREPGHELQSVLDSFKKPNRMPDLFGLAANEHADGNSSQHICQTVRAFQRHLINP